MSDAERILAALAELTEPRLRELSNATVQGIDQYTMQPEETVGGIAWALGRLCHKLGLDRETMHALLDKAYEGSVRETGESN